MDVYNNYLYGTKNSQKNFAKAKKYRWRDSYLNDNYDYSWCIVNDQVHVTAIHVDLLVSSLPKM